MQKELTAEGCTTRIVPNQTTAIIPHSSSLSLINMATELPGFDCAPDNGSARPAEVSEMIVLACGRRRASIERVSRRWSIDIADAVDLMATVELAQNGGADAAADTPAEAAGGKRPRASAVLAADTFADMLLDSSGSGRSEKRQKTMLVSSADTQLAELLADLGDTTTLAAPAATQTSSIFSGPIKDWAASQAVVGPTPCDFGLQLGRQCTRESGHHGNCLWAAPTPSPAAALPQAHVVPLPLAALVPVPLPALALATEWEIGYTEKMLRVVAEQVAVEDTLCAERCPTPAGWPYPCDCPVCARAHRYIKITKHAVDTHNSDARNKMRKIAGVTNDMVKMLINPRTHKTNYSPAFRACHWYKGHQAKGQQKKATFNSKP